MTKPVVGFVVNFQFGCRNGTLQARTKISVPVPYEKGETIYGRLVAEKMGKGYVDPRFLSEGKFL